MGRRTLPILVLASLALALIPAVPAHADGEDETHVGYVLVQQALGHLAHGNGHAGMDEALEKIGDALETDDNAGVDLALVEQARTAVEAEDVSAARSLLQRSIEQAVSDLPAATGEQTGTTVVTLPLRGRGSLTGEDWAFAVGSALLLLVGVVLAFRFRPHDTIGQLRLSLTREAKR